MKKIYIIFSWHVEIIEKFQKKVIYNDHRFELIKNIFVNEDKIKHSLLIQSDIGIENACGNPNYLFYNWYDFLKEKSQIGHEIGWHFHSYFYDNQWRQSTNYDEFGDDLIRSFNSIKTFFDIKSVSTGWCFGNTQMTNTFDSLGIKVDASCLPGIKSKGWIHPGFGEIGKLNIHDWGKSNIYPYYPSKNDYQIQDEDPETNLKILEIPVTVNCNVLYSLNENHFWYKRVLNEAFEKASKSDELIYLHGYSHNYNMIGEGLQNYYNNIDYLVSLSKKYKVELEFVTLDEFRKIWIEKGRPFSFQNSNKGIINNSLELIDKIKYKFGNAS
jgi:hypothetical protein